MRILSKINLILSWLLEVFVGLFFPFLLIFASLFVDTNEGNRLIQTPGFPIVLTLIALATVSMFVGLLFYTLNKNRKLAWWFMIIGAVLFLLGAIGIGICTLEPSGAVSQKITGGDRMNGLKLIYRHLLPLFIPLFVLFSYLCDKKAEDKELYKEAIEEIQGGNVNTLN